MKRIISLLLVVVMMALSLASCAYSYANDDMTKYASLDKTVLDAFLQAVEIEDGDFTADEETRQKKLADAIVKALVAGADANDHKTEGQLGKNDLLYYHYYATYENYVFFTDYLEVKSSASSNPSAQFGLTTVEGLNAAIWEAIKDKTFVKDDFYTVDSAATTKDGDTTKDNLTAAGDKIVVSYTVEWTDDKGTPETTDDTVTKHTVTKNIVVLPTVAEGATADKTTFLGNLIGVKINTKLTAGYNATVSENNATTDGKFTVVEEGITKTYSAVTVNWVIDSGNATEVTFNPNSEKTGDAEGKVEMTDALTGQKVEISKDASLTYHVFPRYYVDVVDELTADAIIETIFGKNFSSSSFTFFTDLKDGVNEDDERKNEDYKYSKQEGEGEDKKYVTIGELAAEFGAAWGIYLSAKNEYKTASEADASDKLATAKDAAQKVYDAAKTYIETTIKDSTADKTEATAALTALNTAIAKTDGTEAERLAGMDSARIALLEKLVALKKSVADLAKADVINLIKTVDGKSDSEVAEFLMAEYKDDKYDSLEKTYQDTIKKNIAKAIWTKICEKVSVTAYPEAPINESYDKLIESYKSTFYGTSTATSDINGDGKKSTYYYEYGGNFDQYVISKADEIAKKADKNASITTYAQATETLKGHVKTEYVKEILQLYTVAKAYDKLYTDAEFNAYKSGEDTKAKYQSQLTAGATENDIRNALQFDKLMNYFLEVNEPAEGAEENPLDYKNIKYTIKADD